ncbi:MAG: ATP-binding protein [Candidatus Bathyarchaeia archaeon]
MPRPCSKCRSAAAEVELPYAKLRLCPSCFSDFFVARVGRTVEEFRMFREGDRVAVAISGGKDSGALLHALRRAFPGADLIALHANLGIPEYSAHCQSIAERLAGELGVELRVFDLKRELGVGIGDFQRTQFKGKLCSACGTVKRHIFEDMAMRAGAKALATGHNLDDMVGIMLSNFLFGYWDQFIRLKPVLPPLADGMASRIKPLIRSPEREDLLYCLYERIPFKELGCPFSKGAKVRRMAGLLEAASEASPQLRHQLLNRFLELMPLIEASRPKPEFSKCRVCGFPSQGDICAYCKRIALVKGALDARSAD